MYVHCSSSTTKNIFYKLDQTLWFQLSPTLKEQLWHWHPLFYTWKELIRLRRCLSSHSILKLRFLILLNHTTVTLEFVTQTVKGLSHVTWIEVMCFCSWKKKFYASKNSAFQKITAFAALKPKTPLILKQVVVAMPSQSLRHQGGVSQQYYP